MPAGVTFAVQASPEFSPEALRAHVSGPCRVSVVLEESGPPASVSIDKCPESLAAASLKAARESSFQLVGTRRHSVRATFSIEYPFAWHVYEQRWSVLQLTAPQITDRRYTAVGPPLQAEPRVGHIRQVSGVRPAFPEHANALGAKAICEVVVHVGLDGVPVGVTRKDCPDVFYPNAAAAARSSRFAVDGIAEGDTIDLTYSYSFWVGDLSTVPAKHPLTTP